MGQWIHRGRSRYSRGTAQQDTIAIPLDPATGHTNWTRDKCSASYLLLSQHLPQQHDNRRSRSYRERFTANPQHSVGRVAGSHGGLATRRVGQLSPVEEVPVLGDRKRAPGPGGNLGHR